MIARGMWVAAVLAVGAKGAYAYNCRIYDGCGVLCGYHLGNAALFRINANDFTTAGAQEITDAAVAWNAGPGRVLRGADWQWVRNDILTDGGIGDGDNNVRKKSDTWFTTHGYGSNTLAGTNTLDGSGAYQCITVEADITYRETVTYSTLLPSENPDIWSIGQIAAHEFGHALGFRHENDYEATMNKSYPVGGDIAGVRYRIHEDDYVGLTNAKPDSSTGKTLMLSKFRRDGLGTVDEIWSDDEGAENGKTWSACRDSTVPAAEGPTEILALITGTPTVAPKIEWTLDSGSICFSGAEYSLGTRTPTISANTPYAVSPNGGYSIPNYTPTGFYHLCAKIDSDDAITESAEDDNIIRSEKLFEVLPPCP